METSRPETMQDSDVIELLLHQHSLIQDLFAQVEAAHGKQKRELWWKLVRLLAVHETAEEEIVHPAARRAIADGGDEIVDDRLKEEHEAKQLLQRLDGMDPDDGEFPPLLRRLRDSVLEHARAEERYEFPYLQKSSSTTQRRTMAAAVKTAEAAAPTHPHPGVESATANVLVGTPTAIMDRIRDTIRKAKPGE